MNNMKKDLLNRQFKALKVKFVGTHKISMLAKAR